MGNKDTSLIPFGHYCYQPDMEKIEATKEEEHDGSYPIVVCPYKTHKEIDGVKVPYCSFLELHGDSNNWEDEEYEKLIKHFGSEEEMDKVLVLSELWDGCKECGENIEREDLPHYSERTEEDIKKIDALDKQWRIKIKNLKGE